MAYETYVDSGAQPVFQHPADDASTPSSNQLISLTNAVAALVSVALVVGVGVWSYKLMMRDVTGIPVVRAMEGDMRIRPETPGGELARHQGLAVNAVAADGGAQDAAERLILAPQPVRLTEEDVPLDEKAVAIVQQAIADNTVVIEGTDDAALVEVAAEEATSSSAENVVAALTGATEAEEIEETVQVAAVGNEAVIDALKALPGVKTSLRPQLRPKSRVTTAVATPTDVDAAVQAALKATSTQDVDPATLPTGTRLAQLGAYDTTEIALAEWDKAAARFGDLMVGKDRVVQQASSGGRTFYRLRAHGFADLADARRFCSALIAEGGDCIPVVTR